MVEPLTQKEKTIFKKLGFNDYLDVLTYYPYRYESFDEIDFNDWKLHEKITFTGILVKQALTSRYNRIIATRFLLMYQSHTIKVVIFNRPWIANAKPGQKIVINGKYNGKEVVASNYSFAENKQGLRGIYHLKPRITNDAVYKLISKNYKIYHSYIQDEVPADFIKKYRLLNRATALKLIHFPKTLADIKAARRTLVYEEFLLHQLAVLITQEESKIKSRKIFSRLKIDEFIKSLPYSLTAGQEKSMIDILNDLSSEKEARCLLQGEVGSGKTLVSAIAIYANYLSGFQSAFMVPTEVLALQQTKYLQDLFKDCNLRVEVLFSGLKSIKKREILNDLKSGNIDVIVGTHSLFQDEVEFKKLGFVVADEQQRFGVKQRERLINKGAQVDLLLMSATPIPRTLASILFGNLKISTIDTLIEDRLPIKTTYLRKNNFQNVKSEILPLLLKKQQGYIVGAAIEESDNVKTILEIESEINASFKESGYAFKTAILHGKLTSLEKSKILDDFNVGIIDILISTTVIEVGIDVKNASFIVIYDAQMFGLSQLHQLRGRVGRSGLQSYCFILSESQDEETIERLEVIEKTTSGFEIAKHDLEFRGPGDMLGIRQSGIPMFSIGNLITDFKVLEIANQDAQFILKNKADYHRIISTVGNKIKNESEE